jgi:hypothetical protein
MSRVATVFHMQPALTTTLGTMQEDLASSKPMEQDFVLIPSVLANAGLILEAHSYYHHSRSELRGPYR